MHFFDYILEPPSYGWKDADGHVVKPTRAEIFREFYSRLNIFKSRKNWMTFTSWFQLLCLSPFFLLFWFRYFDWGLLLIALVYSMVLMGTHGTVWYHRYCTHRAFKFKSAFWRIITQHLVIKTVFEEIYAISHHVHHAKSDEPGDPYNATCGFWYCFLADANHQPVNRNLSESDYRKVVRLLDHTGVRPNSYAQYQKWGSVEHPFRTIVSWILNWSFWFGAFYLIGEYLMDGRGFAFVCCMFAAAGIWTVGVRTFNYEGHGKGKLKHTEGVDFNKKDLSINQIWPGYVAGEWHNNHHLFPSSARSGFLPYQLDLAYCYIYLLHKIGGVSSYHDSKPQFMKQFYEPSLDR